MGRCNECFACKVIFEAQKKFAGTNKNNKNKPKYAERQHTCENPTPLCKKRRINEVENLRLARQNGWIQLEVSPPPSLAIHYIYMFIAEDELDEMAVDVAAGYSGLSKDHVYWSKGGSKEASSIAVKGLMDAHRV